MESAQAKPLARFWKTYHVMHQLRGCEDLEGVALVLRSVSQDIINMVEDGIEVSYPGSLYLDSIGLQTDNLDTATLYGFECWEDDPEIEMHTRLQGRKKGKN